MYSASNKLTPTREHLCNSYLQKLLLYVLEQLLLLLQKRDSLNAQSNKCLHQTAKPKLYVHRNIKTDGLGKSETSTHFHTRMEHGIFAIFQAVRLLVGAMCISWVRHLSVSRILLEPRLWRSSMCTTSTSRSYRESPSLCLWMHSRII